MAQTRIIAAQPTARVTCVVVHGRGQSQDDMMDMIVGRLDRSDVRYVLPKSDDVGWYAARAIDPLTDTTRAELQAALTLLDEVMSEAAAPGLPVLLAGFSQGACLAVEYLMTRGPVPAAAALLTGCRVGTRGDGLPLSDLRGLPVYASCGDDDPWIPAQSHFEMLGDLTRAGARLRMDMFPGRPHDVAPAEIAVLSGMLADLAQVRPLLGGRS